MSPPTSGSSGSAVFADSSDSKKTVWSRVGNEADPTANESTHVMGADSWPALGESAPKSDGSASIPAPVSVNNQLKVNSPSPDSGRGKPKSPGGPTLLPLPLVESTQKILDKPVNKLQEFTSKSTKKDSPKGNLFSPNTRGGFDYYQRPHKSFTRRLHNGGDPPNGRPHMPPSPPLPFLHQPQFIMSTRLPPAGAVQFVGPPPPGAGLFVGPPPPAAGAGPFAPPLPPVRPFVSSPFCFPGTTSPFFYVMGPPPPAHVAAHSVAHSFPSPVAMDAAVLKQIEYYFSNDNLCRDEYLRKHMDAEGWVSASLIAGFNRVKQITQNIPNSTKFILDLLRNSEKVEVQGEKIRRRGDWKTWILPTALSETQTNAARGLHEDRCGWHLSSELLTS